MKLAIYLMYACIYVNILYISITDIYLYIQSRAKVGLQL